MPKKSYYDRMGEKITPGIVVVAIIIIILKLLLKK
jgi:hypothetical protein